ncbi:MAG: DUF4007 family protein [Armatimonadetes bacterium]|nr:DUF4007 family protein [Armatimonadota bacterium]
MHSGLTATMHFGFSAAHASAALVRLASEGLRFGRDAESARALGLGTVQLEALGAWMRYAGLVVRAGRQAQLTPFARLTIQYDPDLHLPLTWWAIHWHLATNYIVWRLLSRLGYRRYSIAELDSELASVAPEQSEQTIRNARQAFGRPEGGCAG